MSLIVPNKDYDKILLDKLVACYEEKLGKASKVIDAYFQKDFVNRCIFFEVGVILVITSNERIVIPFRSILGYSIKKRTLFTTKSLEQQTFVEEKVVEKTNTGSIVKRGLVGAFIGGNIGALIGGLTAKKEVVIEKKPTKAYIKKEKDTVAYAVQLSLNDLKTPTLIIDFDIFESKLQEFTQFLDIVLSMSKEEYKNQEYSTVINIKEFLNVTKSTLNNKRLTINLFEKGYRVDGYNADVQTPSCASHKQYTSASPKRTYPKLRFFNRDFENQSLSRQLDKCFSKYIKLNLNEESVLTALKNDIKQFVEINIAVFTEYSNKQEKDWYDVVFSYLDSIGIDCDKLKV